MKITKTNIGEAFYGDVEHENKNYHFVAVFPEGGGYSEIVMMAEDFAQYPLELDDEVVVATQEQLNK